MPIQLDEDLEEGLKLTYRMTATGEMVAAVTVVYHAKDLTAAGDIAKLTQALQLTAGGVAHTGANLPDLNDTINVLGVLLYAREFVPEPWPPADAIIKVTYIQDEIGEIEGFFGPALMSGGTSTELRPTAFDYTNRQLALTLRTPISVEYDATSLVPQPASKKVQGGEVPFFAQNSVVHFSRRELTDPSGRSRQFAGKKNSVIWFGLAIGTVLCMNVTFDELRTGGFDVVYSFAYDPEEKWDRILQWINPRTGRPPKLETGDLLNSNGVTLVVVQGSDDFNALLLP